MSHDGTGVLSGVPSPFRVTRYHSLTVDPATVPDELQVTATSDSGMIMAMRHKTLPVHSVQFHPESVMTQYGHLMLANWLNEAGRQAGTGDVVPAERWWIAWCRNSWKSPARSALRRPCCSTGAGVCAGDGTGDIPPTTAGG